YWRAVSAVGSEVEGCGLSRVLTRGAQARARYGVRRGESRRKPCSRGSQDWTARRRDPRARGAVAGSACRLHRVKSEDSGRTESGKCRRRSRGGVAGEAASPEEVG